LIAGGLWRCACVVVQEARQELDQLVAFGLDQLVAFGLGQWGEQVVLDGGDEFVELSQVAAAGSAGGRVWPGDPWCRSVGRLGGGPGANKGDPPRLRWSHSGDSNPLRSSH